MRERMALVGGDLSVEGQPGEGTTIAARVPLRTVRPPVPQPGPDGEVLTDDR
jgi:signal transduction histidine kinase